MSELLDLLCKGFFMGAFDGSSKYGVLSVVAIFGLVAFCLLRML